MEVANQSSWKTKDRPFIRRQFDVSLSFSQVEADKLRRGLIPKDMDDRWFIFYEDSWLYLYRSWSGDCIYGVLLEETEDGGARVKSAWVTSDVKSYWIAEPERHRKMISDIIYEHLLSPN